MCTLQAPPPQENILAKPNYSFEKRQREIAKKKQQDEKQAKKKAARESAKGSVADAEGSWRIESQR